MDQRVWWSWKGAPDEDTSHPVPVDEETQLLFVQEALGWGKVVIQGSFFQTHGLLYSQVGHCIQVAMGQGSSQNILRCKIFQVDLCQPIAEPVAAALAVYDNLKKLKLCELNIDLVTVHAIFDALQSNTGLQTLVLDSVYLADEAWTVVGRALARNKTLQHLRLRRTLSPTGLEAVCTIIINNKSLKSLDISDNRIGDEGMMHLLKALTVNRSIERVVLSSNAFGDHGAHILAKVVQQSSTLVLLDVDSNNIGKMGARELGPALAANTTLQVLRLSRNFLDDASVASIAAAAGRHKKLEQLDLSFNRMGPEGVQALAQHIMAPSRAVDSLLLHGNCMIGSEGALHLAKVLPRARKLTRLDLSDCEIGDEGALALAKGLARNKSLLDFRIAHNQITHEGAAAFAAALRSNKTLKYFDFSFNWVGQRGIAPLKEVQAQVAERCHMVWELSLEYCQIEKFKYGDYTTQPDDTSTQQDQQDTPLSPGENPWSPRSGEPSEDDTHVTSTLTAISENRLEGDSVRPPLSTRSLSVADGAHGPQSNPLPHSTSNHVSVIGGLYGVGNDGEIQVAPLPSHPSGPDRADSFESVSLGGVPPSPLGYDTEAITPGKSEPRVPFQPVPSGLRRETREEVVVAEVGDDARDEIEVIQANGHVITDVEHDAAGTSDMPLLIAVRTVSGVKASADNQGLPSPCTAELALASPHTTPQLTSAHPTADSAAASLAEDDSAPQAAEEDVATCSKQESGESTALEADADPSTNTSIQTKASRSDSDDVASARGSDPTVLPASSSTADAVSCQPEVADSADAPSSQPEAADSANAVSSQPEVADSADAPSSQPEVADSADAPSSQPEAADSADVPSSQPEVADSADAPSSQPEVADSADAPSSQPVVPGLPTESVPITDALLQEADTIKGANDSDQDTLSQPSTVPDSVLAGSADGNHAPTTSSAAAADNTESAAVAPGEPTTSGTVATDNPESAGTADSLAHPAANGNGHLGATTPAVGHPTSSSKHDADSQAQPSQSDVADLLGDLGSPTPAALTETVTGGGKVRERESLGQTDVDADGDLTGLEAIDLGHSATGVKEESLL